MGCDIHFFTERLTTDNNYQGPKDVSEERENKLNEILINEDPKERWVSADEWVREKDWDSDDEDKLTWEVPYGSNYYNGRNYYLFSILADVRNYGEEITPIDYPRGIPEDASTGYKFQVDRWAGDGHSHSYFTLEELLNVDWETYNNSLGADGYLNQFLDVIEKMKEIDSDPSKVRCVFFFDN